MTDKIALLTDELTGKVLGYRTDGIFDYDTLADKSAEQIIQQACYDGKDVYYIDGELQVREKDPAEYNNKYNSLVYALSDVRYRIKQGITESKGVEELISKEKQIVRDIKTLEDEREAAMKANSLKACRNLCSPRKQT